MIIAYAYTPYFLGSYEYWYTKQPVDTTTHQPQRKNQK